MSYAKSRKIIKHGKPPKTPKIEGFIMKKFVKILLAVAALVATLLGFSMLTGCTKEPNITVVLPTTIETTTTTERTTTTVAELTSEELYVQHVKDETTLDNGMNDDAILSYGQATCDYLSAGGTGEDLARTIAETTISNGLTQEDALQFGRIAVMAAQDLCPENLDQIRIGLG